MSLLERLMTDFPLYQKNDGVYNNCFVTKLLRNYRWVRTRCVMWQKESARVFRRHLLMRLFQVSSCHSQDSQRALLWRRVAGLCRGVFTQLVLQMGIPSKAGIYSAIKKKPTQSEVHLEAVELEIKLTMKYFLLPDATKSWFSWFCDFMMLLLKTVAFLLLRLTWILVLWSWDQWWCLFLTSDWIE